MVNKDILSIKDLNECKEELKSLKQRQQILVKVLKTTKNPLLRVVKGSEVQTLTNTIELLTRKIEADEASNA